MSDENDDWSRNWARKLREHVELISEIEFSIMLEEPLSKVRWWRSHGAGPKYVKLGRSIYYTLPDIRAWIADNTHPASHEETEGKDVTIFAS